MYKQLYEKKYKECLLITRKFRQSGRDVPHHPVHPLLGLWEHFHIPDFNYIEFEAIETEAGLNSFVLTPKRWVEQTTD